jgi:hypothetical protein
MIHESLQNLRSVCFNLVKRREEQKRHTWKNLKYARNKIAHSNNRSLSVFFDTHSRTQRPAFGRIPDFYDGFCRKLCKENILLSTLIVHEITEEIQDQISFHRLQLPTLYPRYLTTLLSKLRNVL